MKVKLNTKMSNGFKITPKALKEMVGRKVPVRWNFEDTIEAVIGEAEIVQYKSSTLYAEVDLDLNFGIAGSIESEKDGKIDKIDISSVGCAR